MAEQYFQRKYTKEKMEKMSREEYFEKLGDLEDKYSEGFINMD